MPASYSTALWNPDGHVRAPQQLSEKITVVRGGTTTRNFTGIDRAGKPVQLTELPDTVMHIVFSHPTVKPAPINTIGSQLMAPAEWKPGEFPLSQILHRFSQTTGFALAGERSPDLVSNSPWLKRGSDWTIHVGQSVPIGLDLVVDGSSNFDLALKPGQDLLLRLPPGQYRVRAYAHSETTLGSFRIHALLLEDDFVLQDSSRLDSMFLTVSPIVQTIERNLRHSPSPAPRSETFFTNLPPPQPASTEGSAIRRQIEQIRRAPHGTIPPAQATPSALGGKTSMVVENQTEYVLTVFLSGPASEQLQIAPGASQIVTLLPGNYEIAAKVSNPSVIPFYGAQTLSANSQYSENFYIEVK